MRLRAKDGGEMESNMYSTDEQNQNSGNGDLNNIQQDWAQQQNMPQRPVVINELANKKDGKVATALVLGIMGCVFFWLPFISIILCVIGIVLGIINLAKTKQHTSISIAGLILSAIGLILSIFLSFVYILIVFS